ncbi:hypothetical protein JW935_12300 [candidate division KSB1 bacterium]|nr:hypothetical protein [candidate division KSB1 bacterium]
MSEDEPEYYTDFIITTRIAFPGIKKDLVFPEVIFSDLWIKHVRGYILFRNWPESMK